MAMDDDHSKMRADGLMRRTFVKAAGAAALIPLAHSTAAGAVAGDAKGKFDGIKAIAFDTVGTLLDTYGSITRKGAQFTKARGINVDWFQLLDQWRAEWRKQVDEVIAGTVPWVSNDIIYRNTLDTVLVPYDWGTKLSPADRDRLSHLWYEIDPWPDTKAGLERLQKKYILTTLSNGSMASLVNMVKVSKLPFDCILTAELVKSAKPDPKVYALVTNSLNLRPDQVMMVAAHKYDLKAAKKFGFSTAFLPRPMEYGPHGKVDLTPEDYFDVMEPDLGRIAGALGA